MEQTVLQIGTLFHRVFHDSPVGMVITTLDEGRYVEVNRAFAELLGYAPVELIGQTFPVLSLVHEEERNLVTQVLRATGKLADIPLLLRTRDGAIRTAVASVQMEDFDGQPYLVSLVQDLTDHARVQSALRSVESRSRVFFQSIPLPLIIFDSETLHIIDVNPAACRVYGYSHDEFTRLSILDIRPEGERERFRAVMELVRLGKEVLPATWQHQTWQHQRKDGSVFDAEVTGYSFDLDGRPARLSIVQDVTEQRAREAGLRAAEQRLRLIADVTTDAVWDRDLATDAVAWNSGLHSQFGFDPNDDLPHGWWLAHVHPDERDATETAIQNAFASGESRWMGEYRFLRADGRYANVLDRGYIVRDATGRPTRFVGAMVDITRQLQLADAAARATLQERQRLANDLHEAVTQSLYSASLMAEAARRHAADHSLDSTTDYLDRLSQLSKQALRQLRLLVYELRPSPLAELGLVDALRHRLEAVEQRAGINARLEEALDGPLPAGVQAGLFTFAQEALNAALRHSMATHTTVRLATGADGVTLDVEYDGLSPDGPTPEGNAGLESALSALRGRAAELDGDLAIEARDDTLLVRLVLARDGAEPA